jgi:hypothetical protein
LGLKLPEALDEPGRRKDPASVFVREEVFVEAFRHLIRVLDQMRVGFAEQPFVFLADLEVILAPSDLLLRKHKRT